MAETSRSSVNLVRGLGLAAAASIVVGNMVGQGVFLKARVMACNVETPAAVLAVWVVAGALTVAGALALAELATMMPESGGIYVFLRAAYGPAWGFLYGWMNFAVASVSVTIGGVAFAIFLNAVSGGAFAGEVLSISFYGWKVSMGAAQMVALSAIAAVMLINCAAVSFGGRVATVLTAMKILLVAGAGAGAFALAEGNWANFTLSGAGGACSGVAQSARGGPAGFGAAMLGALFAYNGWQAIVMLAGEVKRPSRNLPLAIIGGILVVVALYAFVNAAYFYVLTPAQVTGISANSSVATEAVAKFLGPSAARVMAAALLISTFGTLQINNMMLARSVYAVSRDGLFPRRLSEVSPRTHVPVKAVITQAAWAMVLVFFGSYDTLTDYLVFALWIFYGLAVAAVFVLRRKKPDAERPYRAAGYPLVPALFLLATFWLLASTLWTSPVRSVIGLLLISLGLPVYWYYSARTRRTAKAPSFK